MFGFRIRNRGNSRVCRLLKQDHLDLRITAYAVLPTSSSDGLIEFVPGAYTISSVQAQHGSVAAFLSAYHPEPRGPGGIRPDVHENYVRSCAGCMVAAHVLGIGDRHLDNIMLTTDGRLFHIDFGYAFGRDPKFGNNAPLVLSPVLVEGMGGTEGPGYRRFITLCGEAFNILRKSARLLLSLVYLMAGSSIPDIRSDPERAVLKVQERLRLDLSDEEAAVLLEGMLSTALAAWMPRLAEVQHRMAQVFR
jgi:phosphatidylinositol 3-kinase